MTHPGRACLFFISSLFIDVRQKSNRNVKILTIPFFHATMRKTLPATIMRDFVCNSLKEVQA